MRWLRYLFGTFIIDSFDNRKGLCIAFFASLTAHIVVIYLLAMAIPQRNIPMESILVDFAVIDGIGRTTDSGKGNIPGKPGSNLQVKGEQGSGRKHAAARPENALKERKENETHDYTEPAYNDIVSLSARAGSKSVGHEGASSSMKTGKANHEVSGFYSGGGQGGFGSSGRGYQTYSDYSFVREAVMKNLRYPERARRLGWEGKVVLTFTIHESGLVREVKIAESSGIQILDEAAMEAINKVSVFRNISRRLVVHLPVEFRLKQ